MEENLGIGIRIGLGFGLLLGVMAGVTASGYWRPIGMARPAGAMLLQDAERAEQAARVQADLQGLRRSAKAILLTIESPAQVAAARKAWDEARARQAARLDALESSATGAADKALVTALRMELAAYDAGFTKTLGLIQAGALPPPAHAAGPGAAWTRSSRL